MRQHPVPVHTFLTLMKTGTMKKTIFSLAAALLIAGAFSAAANPVATPELTIVFQQNTAIISWRPVNQPGILRYELQKSTDGEQFSYFCSYAATGAAYVVEDSNLISHTQYYRLRMVDGSGHSLYSPVKSMDLKAVNAELKLMSAQISNRVFVWLPVNTQVRTAQINDADGRVLRADVPVKNNVNIAAVETGDLAAGVYQLQVQTNRGETVKLRFRKK